MWPSTSSVRAIKQKQQRRTSPQSRICSFICCIHRSEPCSLSRPAASQTALPFPKRRCGRGSESDEREENPALPALMMPRLLVQTTFSSLVSAIASQGRGRGVSFPRLFTRPVETTTTKTSLTEGQGYCAVHRVPCEIDGDDGGVSR